MDQMTTKDLTQLHNYSGPNGDIHPCIVSRIVDAQKNTVSAVVFDGSTPTGSRFIANLQYDEKAEHLSEQELLRGKGTPNTWFRSEAHGQARTAGAGH